MAVTIPALVNPPLLVWAREQSGYPPEKVAERLSVDPERLLSWERGDRKPTLRQARELARMYHRPFGVFFLPQPPAVPPAASEFRRLPGVRPREESPELRLALRFMSSRRETALELAEQVGFATEPFTSSARLNEAPKDVAHRLRGALGVTGTQQLAWENEWQASRRWREAVEAMGVLVFQFPKVPLSEARGVALLDFPLPVIGLNSKETSPAARAFTIMHELVHLALARSHEEVTALKERRTDAEWEAVERFVEETASAILIPEIVLDAALPRMASLPAQWTLEAVRSLARLFRVTPLAMATRLRARGVMDWPAYRRWKEDWRVYLESRPAPKKGGFATEVGKALSRNGEPFVRLVLQGLESNQVTAVDASRALGLGFGHFEKLRDALRPRPGVAEYVEE